MCIISIPLSGKTSAFKVINDFDMSFPVEKQ